MPYLSIRNAQHYYEWIPGAPTGEKPVMVFLHGWAGSARYWQATAMAIADRFDCLLYDMRGFGRSRLGTPPPEPRSPEFSLEAYAEDLAALLDALKLPRVYLNAHSMGASVAVLFLQRWGDRIERAILTCSGIFEYDRRAFEAFHQFGGYVVKFRPPWLAGIPLVPRAFMARFLHRSIPGQDQREFLEDFLMADQAAALGTIYTSVSEHAVAVMPEAFAAIAVPTLLVAGEYDQIIPAAMGQAAAALSEQVAYVMLPNTSHFPMLEDPDAYRRCVQAFLDRDPVAIAAP